jgi:hypothetical protein
LADPKDSLSRLKTSMNVMDSPSRDTKTVVQYASGHAFLAFSDFSTNPKREKACPVSLFKQGTHLREEPEKIQ